MAETNSPYTYSGFADHVYTTDEKEIMTLSVSKQCNEFFEPEKPLEERRAIFSRVREEDPDKIPVVIVNKNLPTKKLSLFVESKLNIGDLFAMCIKQFYKLDDISTMTRHDSTADKLISSIYQEHKHEDGCLYMTLSGPVPELLVKALKTVLIQQQQSIKVLKDIKQNVHDLEEKLRNRLPEQAIEVLKDMEKNFHDLVRINRQPEQSIEALKNIEKYFHDLEEKLRNRPRTGRLGGILSFLGRFRTWK